MGEAKEQSDEAVGFPFLVNGAISAHQAARVLIGAALPECKDCAQAMLIYLFIYFLIEERQADVSPEQSWPNSVLGLWVQGIVGVELLCKRLWKRKDYKSHDALSVSRAAACSTVLPPPALRTNVFGSRPRWPPQVPDWVWFPTGRASRTLLHWGPPSCPW